MKGTIIIQRYRIIGTSTIVFAAWEPSKLIGEHSTITTFGGEWYGRIGTNPEKELYDKLPVGNHRSEMVREAYEQKYQKAYDAIIRAFPDASAGRRSMGEITIIDYSKKLIDGEMKI